MALRREREVEFSQPIRPILFMLVTLVATGGIAWFLYEPIETVFQANPWLNGLIVAVFVVGVLSCFRQIWQSTRAVSWIEGFVADRPGHEFARPPRLLTSLATLLKDSRSRAALSATSARTILDSIATRLDESREITRYIGNLLIFLGLLGTFWGLSRTVPAVVDTIRSLDPQDGGAGAFDRLMAGLEDQLGGMGTAFASSLLGLAGSLVVGLLELFAGHGQNRFYRELEEWLSTITRLGFGGEGEGGLGAELVAQNAAQIETLGRLIEQNDGRRANFEDRLSELTESVSRLAGQMRERDGQGAEQVAEAAARQAALLERIATRLEAQPEGEGFGDDAEVRARMRNIERCLLRLLEEVATGREDAVAELRGELAGVTRAVTALNPRRAAE
jgi:hypothetical protein